MRIKIQSETSPWLFFVMSVVRKRKLYLYYYITLHLFVCFFRRSTSKYTTEGN